MNKLKEFFLYFTVQTISYCILTINFRAVEQTNLHVALLTDGINASFSFFIIRKIAKSEESFIGFCGYVAGSLLGTTLGMYLS